MWKWRAEKQKKNPISVCFPCFQSCELLLLSFLSPPMHSVCTQKIVFYLPIAFSAYFSTCFLWDLPVLIFFQGVLRALRERMNPPQELQLCAIHSSGRNTGRKKKNILWKKIQNVFSTSTSSGSCCHIPSARNGDSLPGAHAMGVPRVLCHSQFIWKIQGFFFFLISFTVWKPDVCFIPDKW